MKTLRLVLSVTMLLALLLFTVSTVFAEALQEQHQQFQNVDKQWSAGNINSSNSDYVEGDSIPYRYEFKGVPAGAYLELEIHYDFTRGGKYAFDFLTSVKRTEGSIIDTLTGGLFSSPQSPKTTLAESDCNFSALAIPNDPNITTDDLVINNEGTQYFTICGDYTVATVHDGPTHPTDVSGNSEKVITLRIRANPDGDASQELAVAWGGHLAIGDALNWGVGNGAGSISGAPFHQNGDGFLDVNGSGEQELPDDKDLGNGDRSVNTGAVTRRVGTITIRKVADLESDQEFPFTSTIPDHLNFSLVDDGAGPGVDTVTFSNLSTGSYEVTELVPDGWDLVDIQCTDPDEGTDVDLVEAKALIDLDPEETVECTFYNDPQPGTIIIEKFTVPEGLTDEFGFTDDIESPYAFSLTHGQAQTFNGVEPGQYTVTEDDPALVGDKFSLIGLVCLDSDDGGTDSTTNVVERTATINLDPGETVTCSFTNKKEGPTAVTLASFAAEASIGSVTLAWETGTEMDNAGFNLYRATAPDGPYTKVNDVLIAALGDPVSGANYNLLDKGLAPGTYYYQLEDVDLNGVATLHGPVSATVTPSFRRPAYRPTLPGF